MQYDVDAEIRENTPFLALMEEDAFCCELWTAFANITWYKAFDSKLSESENVLSTLVDSYENRQWGASFRGMGGVIAEIRNDFYDKSEDYMSWYCSNYSMFREETTQEYEYGFITERVRVAMLSLGWKPVEDTYYFAANP